MSALRARLGGAPGYLAMLTLAICVAAGLATAPAGAAAQAPSHGHQGVRLSTTAHRPASLAGTARAHGNRERQSSSQRPSRHRIRAIRRRLQADRRARARKIKGLRECRREHPRHCLTQRRALKHATARVRRERRRLKAMEARAASAKATARKRAPSVRTTGPTVVWQPVAQVHDYVLERKVPGRAGQYSVVKGVSATPTATPGTTVRYAVRTNVAGSRWSRRVAVTYPDTANRGALVTGVDAGAANLARGAGSGHGHGNPHKEGQGPRAGQTEEASPPETQETTSTIEAPATEAPQAVEVSSSTPFQAGIDAGTNLNLDVQGTAKLGAKLARIEFPIDAAPAEMEPVIAAYAEVGVRVLPLAGFYGSMPTPEEARNLASWAKTFGPGGSFWAGRSDGSLAIRDIEYGNETSYGYQYGGDSAGSTTYQARARTYATRVKESAEAISAAGVNVGLLAQEDDWTGNWIKGMYGAVPNLSRYVAGWTIHPYGNEWKGRIEDLVRQTEEYPSASTIPIDITEWGLATDNGRCLSSNYGWNPCMTYAEAATTLTNTFAALRNMLGSRLGMFILYQVRDQRATGESNEREYYFGALQHELQPKGAFTTAVENILATG